MDTSLKKKANLIYKTLKKEYPDAKIALNYKNELQLLIATILSAKCTDIRVNQVTKILFKEFKEPKDYIKKPLEELENIIRPTGFFRQKAKNIKNTVTIIVKEYNSKVPSDIDLLTKLPGVGRKTANVLLSNAFNLPGLPVDTHVKRISNKLGLTKEEDPVKIEKDLNKLLHKSKWGEFSHLLINHGRKTCKARKPLCKTCVIKKQCDWVKTQA